MDREDDYINRCLMMESYKEYEEEPLLRRLINYALVSLRNTGEIYLKPVDTLKRVKERPDYLAPFFFVALLTYAGLNLLRILSCNIYLVRDGNLITVWEDMFAKGIWVIITLKVMWAIFYWIISFILLFLMARLLGSYVEMGCLFSAAGFLNSVNFLFASAEALHAYFYVLSNPRLILRPPPFASKGYIPSEALDYWLKDYYSLHNVYVTFFMIWGFILATLILYVVGELKIKRALIGSLVSYVGTQLMTLFLPFR